MSFGGIFTPLQNLYRARSAVVAAPDVSRRQLRSASAVGFHQTAAAPKYQHQGWESAGQVGIGERKLGHLLGSWSPGLPKFNFFRRDFHAGAKLVAAADHDALAVGKSRKHFDASTAL
jgi:hypothetical protein